MTTTYIGTRFLKLKCKDSELESLVRETVSSYIDFADLREVKFKIIVKLEDKDFFE